MAFYAVLRDRMMSAQVEKRLTAEECFEDHEHRHDRSGAPPWMAADSEAMDCRVAGVHFSSTHSDALMS